MATLGKSDVHYYNSEMTGAPSLSATLGSVINILDACLIDGFGSEVAQGNWERPYGATDKAVYRSTSDKSTGCCLSVDDSISVSSFAVRGYQDVQGYSGESGVNPFPTVAQQGGSGLSVLRMNTSSGSRRWAVYADSCCFYLFIDADVGSNDYANGSWRGGFFFGDIVPYNQDDALHCLVIGGNPTSLATLNSTTGYLAGDTRQVAGSILSFRVSWGHKSNLGQGTQVYPAIADHGFHLWPVEVWDYTASFSDARGMMPGLYNQTHLWSVSDGINYGDHFDVHGNQYRTQHCGDVMYKVVINLTGPWR